METQGCNSRSTRGMVTLAVAVVTVLLSAALLFAYAYDNKSYCQEQVIRDMIWLDVWALLFCIAAIVAWKAPVSVQLRNICLMGLFGIYGFIAVSLIFDGTGFGLNAHLGDQSFRQAMILRFTTDWLPGDFYFKQLCVFYPPVYYGLLAVWGRVFSVEFHHLLKVGHQLVYLLGPILLFWLWSRIVTNTQAALIALATYLTAAYAMSIALVSPPAFIGNALFIPWWIRYVEGGSVVKSPRAHLFWGGLLGGVIFATYPYAMFIGGFLLVARTVALIPAFKLDRRWARFRPASAYLMVALVAAFSSPYWLPAFLSVVSHGSKPPDQEWYHLGHPGLNFPFLNFSWSGLLFLGAIGWSIGRWRRTVHRHLLTLLAGSLLFYLAGMFLGGIDRPINVPKAKEFILFLAGPMIGLAVASCFRLARRAAWSRMAVPLVALLIALSFMHSFNRLATSEMVKTARSISIPHWGLDSTVMAVERRDAVFLTYHMSLPSWYPVYLFLPTNQHFCHPASEFLERYSMLQLTQYLQDPTLFHLVLRHNRFDPVDFVTLRKVERQWQLPVNLSNYPTVIEMAP